MTLDPDPIQVDVHLGPADLDNALRLDVAQGLTSVPKQLSPKWLYDERGCDLFDQITKTEEYYPTEAERALLQKVAPDVAGYRAWETLVELGSGTSDKTVTLLDALHEAGTLRRFVPFDVSESTLRSAATGIRSRYPEVAVHAVVGDFDRHLGLLPPGPNRLVAFLGSTIGNLGPPDRATFLSRLRDAMADSDALLLGLDLVKDPARIEAAYNDAAGITEQFNRNVLTMLNRELGADFEIDAFAHEAVWDPKRELVQIGLRSLREQIVCVADLDLKVDFDDGELLHTEISTKFRRDGITAELAECGFSVVSWWASDVALALAVPG